MYPGADDWRHQELLPEVFALDSGLMCLSRVEFAWALRWTWGQSEPVSIYKELLMSLTPSTHPFLLLLGFLFNSSEFLNHPRLWALKTLIIDHLEELSPKVLLKPYLLTVTSYHYLWDTDSSVRSTPTRSCGWLGTAETGCRAGTLSSMAVMKPVCCCGHEFPAVRPTHMGRSQLSYH